MHFNQPLSPFISVAGLLLIASTFSASTSLANTCSANDAQFIHQRIPDLFTISESKTATVVMKNTGSSTWTRASKHSLMALPLDGTWGVYRVKLPPIDPQDPGKYAIAPGEEYQFIIPMTAPAVDGQFPSEWVMVQTLCNEFGEHAPVTQVEVCQESECPRQVSTRVDEDGNGEFYDRRTGKHIWMRGFNWIRRDPQPGTGNEFHSNFDISPVDRWLTYKPEAEIELAAMAAKSFNVVRVWLNDNQAVDVGNSVYEWPLSYAENFREFLDIADNNEIFVYTALAPGISMDSSPCTSVPWLDSPSNNCYFLTQEGVDARLHLMTDLIDKLKTLGAPMNSIFAYGTNHYYLRDDELPLTMTSGTISPYWLEVGEAPYDMSDPAEKDRLLLDTFVEFSEAWATTLKAVDPGVLTTVSFKNPLASTPSPPAGVVTLGSELDFASIHTYPHPCEVDPSDPSLGRWDEFSTWQTLYEVETPFAKPIFMTEFGAYREGTATCDPEYPILEDAADEIVAFQVDSCVNKVNGWTYWGWDKKDEVNDLVWVGNHEDQFGVPDSTMADALSPNIRPKPCLP